MSIKVSVVVPAYNEEKYIADCIKSLLAQDFPTEAYEIIVVDNGSTDRTMEIAASMGVRVLNKVGNVGAVRNFGVKNANGDVIAFIDSDCVVSKDWITKGLLLINSKENSVYGGGALLRKNASWIETNWLLGADENKVPKDLLGCSIFITKKNFVDVGCFDELISSGEDTLLANALRRNSCAVIMTPEISVIHLGNALTSKDFIKRQAWHGANYIKKINESVKDPTFLLVFIYLMLFILLLVSLFFSSDLLLICFVGMLLIPMIFSLKRIMRSKLKLSSIRQLLQIYYLDTLYVLGRVTGFLKELFEHVSKKLF